MAKKFPFKAGKHVRAEYNLPNLRMRIIKSSYAETNAFCEGATHYDDRTPIGDKGVQACYIRRPGSKYEHNIFLTWDDAGARALIHELHHAEGLPMNVVDEIDWE